MDDQQFRQILDFLGLSWSGFRKIRKGVKKRVNRFMQEKSFQDIRGFLTALSENKALKTQVEQLMAVPISRFFRDRKLWEVLEKHVLPLIAAKQKEKIKVWSAGCASGEEVYSFKILWEEWGKGLDQLPELELWATDMNGELLDRAKTGVYSPSSLKEPREEWRVGYFSPAKGNRLAISDSLKEHIHWTVHNLLLHEPPVKGFQIIFLRNNLLTYYKNELLRPAFSKVIESLSPGGFLIIGAHEKLPPGFQMLPPFPHHPSIFKKTPS